MGFIQVGPFSQTFNAITGLNGSGKSNILDSICFVMALKSLKQMRVDKLDELVYKSGQSQVRKARVTLTFDNTNKAGSPPLYRHCDSITISRMVVVGGRDKYHINNKVARPTEVQGLFHSVGLNVNNPHFLIMQGRIAKVINMQPSGILGLVEEAAGTKIYDMKKRESESRMQRKENELQIIDEIINKDINPQMEKLSKDREHHRQWTTMSKDITETQKKLILAKYLHMVATRDKFHEKQEHYSSEYQRLGSDIQTTEASVKELAAQLERLTNEDSAEEAKKQIALAQSKMKEATSTFQISAESLKTKQRSLNESTKKIDKVKKALAALDKKAKSLKDGNSGQLKRITDLETQATDIGDEIVRKEGELEGIRTGNIQELDDDGKSRNLMDLIHEKNSYTKELEAEVEELSRKVLDLEEDLKNKPSKDDSFEKIQKLREDISKGQKRAQQITDQQKQLDFDHDNYRKAKETRDKLDGEKRDYERLRRERFEAIKSNSARNIIAEKDKVKNLRGLDDKTRETVVGPVFTLFDVKENYQEYNTALEQIAGAKLTNVVVSNDKSTKVIFPLMRGGQCTLLPLNTINPYRIDERRLEAARKAVPDLVHPYDIIDIHNKDHTKAVHFVFGGAVICRDRRSAALVKDCGIKALTIDGDIYDPSGNVSGGSYAGFHDLLNIYAKVSDVDRQIEKCAYESASIAKYLSDMDKSHENWNKMNRESEKERRNLVTLTNFLKAEQETSAAGDREALIMELNQSQEEIKRKNDEKQKVQQQVLSLQKKQSTNKKESSKLIKQLENELPKLRDKSKEINKAWDAEKAKNQDMFAELEGMDADREQKNETIQSESEAVVKLTKEIAHDENEVAKLKGLADGIAKTVKDLKDDMANSNERCSKVKSDIDVNTRKVDKLKLSMEKKEEDLKAYTASYQDSAAEVSLLEEANKWVLEDTRRHFENFDPKKETKEQLKKKLDQLEVLREKLAMKFNKKVLQKIDEAERSYKNTMENREKVLKDRESLVNFMQELDRKKESEVAACREIVNENFNLIFQTLLPGTEAALVHVVDEKKGEEGLQMKVAFHGKWKAGLTDLSGGQRSLLALSFILSLLKYKPAPLYILDEVDAALDLSHTQNIGKLINEHFRGSQFIIVSLKPNLFSNADVIFKTGIRQGVSSVRRLTGTDAMVEMVENKRKQEDQKKMKALKRK